MQNLEGACEEDERAIKRLKSSRPSLPLLQTQNTIERTKSPINHQSFDIFTKFQEIYNELESECTETNSCNDKTGLKRNSLILEKLVMRERLNTLILKLYAGNKGYSLAFRKMSVTSMSTDDTANMIETKQWPYEEDELLRYIDNEELPPHLTDLFKLHYSFLFYNGCIIIEVRDYRQAYPDIKCNIHHVLLRPTLKTILADINNLADDKPDWGADERHILESQILLANKPALCLDPSNTISRTQTRIYRSRQMWKSHGFQRAARKFSQVTVNRKRKLDQQTYRPGLELYNYISKARSRPVSLFKHKRQEVKPIPVPKLDLRPISPPTQGVYINEFKTYQRPKETSDCLPQLIEEYVLETDMPTKEKGKQRVYHIKLSILQRPSNSEYLGELYLDRDHKKNERNGVACRFSLGSRANANRYIHQFTEIFTESGRKSVRIRYGLSPGYKERVAMAQAQAQMQAQSVAQANLAQQHLTQLSQTLQNQSCTTQLINGTVGSRINLVQQNQTIQNTSNIPILQSHLQQGTTQMKSQVTSQELKINAIATEIMNTAEQFEAAANAKQQQQQQQHQKLTANRKDTAIINLLNSSPASNVNSDASAAVVNAINNSSLLTQQVQTLNQKLLARKMTLSNVANARVINHANLITVNNNNRINLSELNQHQQQTITLTSVNNSGTYTNFSTIPIKQQQQLLNATTSSTTSTLNDTNNESTFSALLVGTPAADRPDIIGSNTNSLLLKKFASSTSNTNNCNNLKNNNNNNNTNNFSQSTHHQQQTHFIKSTSGQQFMLQQSSTSSSSSSSSKNTVLSPLSSPPTQNVSNTINVQSLNFAQLQSIQGLQNVQVQLLPGFAQPISLLNVSSTGTLQGHPTSLLVTLPVATSSSTSNTITQSSGNNIGNNGNSGGVNSIGVGTPTVVLANAGSSNIAQLVASGMKGINQQNLRTSTIPTTVALNQTNQPIQLLTSLQRPRMQQSAIGLQSNRTIQRTPITIKMATTQNPNAALNASLTQQLQKQVHLQQYQQLYANQQKNVTGLATGKLRRRSNTSSDQ